MSKRTNEKTKKQSLAEDAGLSTDVCPYRHAGKNNDMGKEWNRMYLLVLPCI